MIAELKNYPGVFCIRCGGPTPVSAKVANLLAERDGTADGPHAFVIRCKLCVYESVYSIAEIRTFEGQPPMPNPKTRAAASP